MYLTATTATNTATRSVNEELNYGTISISATIVIVALLSFFLLMAGKFPGVKLKRKGEEIAIGASARSSDVKAKTEEDVNGNSPTTVYTGEERRKNTMIDTRILYMAQLIMRRRLEMSSAIKLEQKKIADEAEDSFWPILTRFDVSEWQIETAWARIHIILYSMADQNHVMDYCRDPEDTFDPGYVPHDGKMISNAYIEDKTSLFERRYIKLLSRDGSGLPNFAEIRAQVRGLLADTVCLFSDVADRHEARFSRFMDDQKQTVADPEIRNILERLGQRESVD